MEDRGVLILCSAEKLFREALATQLAVGCLPVATPEEALALAMEHPQAPLLLVPALAELPEWERQIEPLQRPVLWILPSQAFKQTRPAATLLQRPFARGELQEAVGALLARPCPRPLPGGGSFDPAALTLSNGDSLLALTEREAQLLQKLLESMETPLPRETLLTELWGHQAALETHTLETHLSRLRGKLKELLGENLQIQHRDGGYLLVAAYD